MYQVLLAIKSKELQSELRRLRIWGDTTGFVIKDSISDEDRVLTKLHEEKYDLVIIEHSDEVHALTLLRQIKSEKCCDHVVIVSSYVDFQDVRKSFLSGVDDYYVEPFEIHHFIRLFSKIENKDHGKIAAEICQKEEIMTMFERADVTIKDRIDEMIYRMITDSGDLEDTSEQIRRILDGVLQSIYKKFEWMGFYFEPEDVLLKKNKDLGPEENVERYVEIFFIFYQEFTELLPGHGEVLKPVIQYILNHPEADLRQKTISEEMYINRSYLSTIFTTQVGVSFVEYVNTVKMKRAAYLLQHTKNKIINIAETLDYKDMGYFLKLFKAKYGVTPSQYRIPETYDFHI